MVAVTTMELERHHLASFTHLISKQAPQLSPLLNRAVLRAAVFVPYPWLYRFPYPQAPPATTTETSEKPVVVNFSSRVSIKMRKF